MEDGIPYQRIEETLTLDIPLEDLSSLPEADREQEAKRLAEEEASKAFDLSKDPLIRSQVLKLSEEDHILLLSLHHIVSDGWSNGIFWQELTSLYNAFLKGKENPLAPLKLQYTDYALWQRKELEGEIVWCFP